MDSVLETLRAHEISHLDSYPVERKDNPRVNGFWVVVAYCKCGHSSPPEHRADHLAKVLGAHGNS